MIVIIKDDEGKVLSTIQSTKEVNTDDKIDVVKSASALSNEMIKAVSDTLDYYSRNFPFHFIKIKK